LFKNSNIAADYRLNQGNKPFEISTGADNGKCDEQPVMQF